ncbi:MAG TPA: hypothetical protein VEF90_06970 [Xanthobacteraceae bacterium]|nr:hypothetical protein [Xanthobacteraceae bacterium]
MSKKLRHNARAKTKRLNPAADMIKRLPAIMAVLGLGLLLASCGSLAASVADHWPHWAGGLPDDVPPRPGAPGYEEFIAHKGTTQDATTASAVEKTSATAPAAATPPPAVSTDQNAVRGGLY